MSTESVHHPWQVFEVGLVTLEFQTAFIIGAAEGDNLFDAVFVSDANGLPCLPGESLAGILRHAVAGTSDPLRDDVCREVFGYQDADGGRASRLRLSFGHVHDQNDRPVPFRGADVRSDSILGFLAAGAGRDHVRIGQHGVVDGSGKFDHLVVPAGARFTFEMWLAKNEKVDLAKLVQVLQRSEIRVGGKSRRGLGRIRVHAVRGAKFDLSNATDVARFSTLPSAIELAHDSDVLKKMDLKAPAKDEASPWIEGTLVLEPVGSWMIGGGIPTGAEPQRSKEGPWDRVPLTERRIVWEKQGGREVAKLARKEEARPLIPGSSVKGALRHRTAFHARRLAKVWLDGNVGGALPFTQEENDLFGEVRSADSGTPGRVFISDVHLAEAAKYLPIQHVSLDRFTQAPMDHLLYDELALGKHRLEIPFTVRTDGLSKEAQDAFAAALDDLCNGRLALGAGRGHGRFKGKVVWRDEKKTIGGLR